MAGRILLIAAIVLGAYIAFIGVVVFTLHVIDWVKDGGLRNRKPW